MENLVKYIKSVVTPAEAELEEILSKFSARRLKKGEIFMKKGQTAVHYLYINEGALRTFNEGEDRQITYWCFLPGDFFSEISSLHHRIPSRFNIEAIADTELYLIHLSDMEYLYGKYALWQEFGRKVWERMCINMIDQSIRFQTLGAEAMYLEFLKVPDLINKLPVGQLASILGITPNALSRIRKNIR